MKLQEQQSKLPVSHCTSPLWLLLQVDRRMAPWCPLSSALGAASRRRNWPCWSRHKSLLNHPSCTSTPCLPLYSRGNIRVVESFRGQTPQPRLGGSLRSHNSNLNYHIWDLFLNFVHTFTYSVFHSILDYVFCGSTFWVRSALQKVKTWRVKIITVNNNISNWLIK